MTKADLLVENGLNLEGGMGDAFTQAEKAGVKRFIASDHITVRHVAEGQGIDTTDPDQAVGAADPHLWMDPLTMKAVVAALATQTWRSRRWPRLAAQPGESSPWARAAKGSRPTGRSTRSASSCGTRTRSMHIASSLPRSPTASHRWLTWAPTRFPSQTWKDRHSPSLALPGDDGPGRGHDRDPHRPRGVGPAGIVVLPTSAIQAARLRVELLPDAPGDHALGARTTGRLASGVADQAGGEPDKSGQLRDQLIGERVGRLSDGRDHSANGYLGWGVSLRQRGTSTTWTTRHDDRVDTRRSRACKPHRSIARSSRAARSGAGCPRLSGPSRHSCPRICCRVVSRRPSVRRRCWA